jgi:hypothetical protein
MMKELVTTYRYTFLCLIAALAVGALFYMLAAWLNDGMWFARGGSLVCLFSLAAEYGLIQVQQQVLNKRVAGAGSWDGPVLENFDIPSPFPRLKIGAHILVISGTFIWGFGDLLV